MRFLPLILLLLSGCIPFTFTRSPGASGVIIDASTGQPLADAEVFMSHATYNLPRTIDPKTGKVTYLTGTTTEQLVPPDFEEALRQYRPRAIIPGSAGRFSIPAQRRWGLFFAGLDVIPPYGTLV